MCLHSLTAEQSLTRLNTSASLLGASETARRRARCNPNRLAESEQMHQFVRSAQECTHIFAVILWIASALSRIAKHFDPGRRGLARPALTIVGAIMIDEIFLCWPKARVEPALTPPRQAAPS